MLTKPLLLAAVFAVAIAGPFATFARDNSMLKQTPMPSFAGAIEWVNSKPLTPAELRGKVVLVDFWTYTCVNWRRTLPYVRAWAEKYKNQGLVVIGVHTPEFGFEKNLDNIHEAIKEMNVDYPVAIDSNYAIWSAFNNQYWPALYFVDAHGNIRHHQFGEGGYEESERVIQRLLADAGERGVGNGIVAVDPRGLEVAADWADVRSPESYLGYERGENFASPGGAALNQPHRYAAPAQLALNEWALSGDWTIGKEAVVLDKPNGRIAYRFHARDVNLIMGPSMRGNSVPFRVLVDGKAPGAARGADVDAGGNGTVSQQGTYQLIRQPKPIVDRQFEIEFFDSGVEAFDFTFG
jgi:thiol-disulfide isomerase/thioredoxin